MIQTAQVISIEAKIDEVWQYTSDVAKWASLMPGYRSCSIIDVDNSRWTLKVGVGALLRTVHVLAHVDQWDGPERVSFSFTLEGDPVKGSGSYIASRKSTEMTDLELKVSIEGGGPMAPMWEAMSGPLLPSMIRSFGQQLKGEIETAVGRNANNEAQRLAQPKTSSRNLWALLRNLRRFVFGS